MISLSKVIGRYRKYPNGLAFFLSFICSLVLATVLGVLGAFAAVMAYDRGMSRGDDFAVSLGGFYAVGIFSFVVAFSWLQKTHHPISYRTSLFALYACLILPLIITLMSADDMDHYSAFVIGDWLGILILGALGLLVCRRWWRAEERGF